MNNNSATLLEQLRLRSVRDLLSIASIYRVSYAEGLSRSDCMRLLRVCDGEFEFDADLYKSFADGGELCEHFRQEIPSNSYDEEHKRELTHYYELRNEIGNQLVLAENSREDAAERIARVMLDPDVMRSAFHDVSDCSMELLRCAAGNSIADRSNSFWQEVSVPDKDRYSAFLLENMGYV